MPCPERLVRPTVVVTERHRDTGVPQQCGPQNGGRKDLGTREADQVRSTQRHGVGVAAVAIERRAHRQGRRTAQTVGGVRRLSGVRRLEKLRSEGGIAEVEANRELRQTPAAVLDVDQAVGRSLTGRRQGKGLDSMTRTLSHWPLLAQRTPTTGRDVRRRPPQRREFRGTS